MHFKQMKEKYQIFKIRSSPGRMFIGKRTWESPTVDTAYTAGGAMNALRFLLLLVLVGHKEKKKTYDVYET